MLKTRFEWTVLLLVAALLGGGWMALSRNPAPESEPIALTEAPIVGHIAPHFTGETPVGALISLDDRAPGQPVVLNFWASWCAPCRVEMPHLQSASRTYNGRVLFLGVNQGENSATITDFGSEFNITYPLLVDQDNKINRLYNVNSLPTTIFIDGNGVVQRVLIGTLTQGTLESNIEGLLASR